MVSIEWVLISFCSTHDINFLITSMFVLSVDSHINELSGYNSPTMIVCSLRWFLLPVPACDLSPHGSSVNHLIPPLPDNERIVWCTSIINVWNSHQLPPPVTCHCYWVNTILPNTFLKTFWKINFNSDILVFHLRQTRQNMPTLTIILIYSIFECTAPISQQEPTS